MKSKRTLFLVSLLVLLPLGGRLSAQAAFKTYEFETVPMQAHVFSADAKTFTFNDGDSIFRLWFKDDGNHEQMAPVVIYSGIKPVAKTALASLPGDGFYFGEKKMKHFGLTGGGLVYFGETDELLPTYNASTGISSSLVQDLVFIKFNTALFRKYTYQATPMQETGLLAGENASVQYEFSATQDTLFVAYNNVKVLDTGNRAFTLSFQYAFTKDGEVLFIPVAMQPQHEPDEVNAKNVFYFSYGLFPEGKLSDGRFLNDEGTDVKSGSYGTIKITKTTYPTQTYRMYPPASCKAVENPSMTQWACTAATDYIELGKQTNVWNEGQACLFILSEESSLSGENLPVDGKEYASGDKIGSSLLVVKGVMMNNNPWLGNIVKATGLTPATTYYLYAFPYYTDCAGIKYNTTKIPSRSVTTAIAPVNTISVDEASITENGFTLNIDKGDAERYILAVSRRQMNPLTVMALSPKKEGVYQVGDKLVFGYSNALVSERYELEILVVDGTEAQYQVTDAQFNTDYYYYVWSTDAEQKKFSFETRSCGVSTLYQIPAVLAFDSASVTWLNISAQKPAGWILPFEVGDKSFKIVEEEQKYLSAALYAKDSVTPLRVEAISPVIKGGKMNEVIVDLYIWKRTQEMPANTSLRTGDTIYIQYKGLSESTWTTLSTITSADKIIGVDTITTKAFYSAENYRLRFVGISTQVLDESAGFANAGIRKITVGSVCKPVSSGPEVSEIMHDRATLSWEDENNTPRAEAYHLRYRLSENDAWTGRISKNRNYTFKGLQNHTDYTMGVAAVCDGDTSAYVEVSFTTLYGLPYTFALASKPGSATPDTLPVDVTLKTGALPAGGAATLAEPDAAKTVWAPMQKSANVYGAGLTTGATLNNPLWLNLPVISTGVSRGKARLSLKLSAWSDGNTAQAATFGATDTLWVLFSKDNKFNATSAKIKVNLSEVTPQGKSYAFDFEVEDAYQYWAVYTNLQTTGNVLFIDSLNLEWTEMYCNAATNVRQFNLSYYSVDISWTGEGVEYGIFYNDRNTDKWDTVYTEETTYTLEGLASGTPYQYYVVVYCDAERKKASDRSAIRYFITETICKTPTIEVLKGTETWHGVTVVTRSEEPQRQFRIDPKDSDRYLVGFYANGKRDTVDIHGLTTYQDTINGIDYLIKVRAICAVDTSEWSETKEFTTLPTPVCHRPSGLKAEVNVKTNVATLSWTAGTNNLSYAVITRAGNALRRDTIYTNYASLTRDVTPDVVYTWWVWSYCEKPLTSDSSVAGPQFGTNVGVESVQSFDKAVKVRIFENQIIIENNDGLYIKSLQAFSVDGKLLRTYPVNSNQNAYIYHTLPKGAALLRVLGENGKTATYKTIIL